LARAPTVCAESMRSPNRPDSLREDEPGNDAMPASDDAKKRQRPASKRPSRTDATKKVVQEEIASLLERDNRTNGASDPAQAELSRTMQW